MGRTPDQPSAVASVPQSTGSESGKCRTELEPLGAVSRYDISANRMSEPRASMDKAQGGRC